jgi:hypothetical protein
MGGVPALKGLNSGWQVRYSRAVPTHISLHTLPGLGIDDTGIKEERINFLCSELKRPVTVARR